MLKIVLIGFLTLSLHATAVGQSSGPTPDQYETTSFGVPDCGQWINKTRPGADVWLMGYLSGINSMFNANSVKPNPMYDPLSELSSADQAFAWMDNWCGQNPLKNVNEGADILHLMLAVKKGQANS